MGQGSSTSKSRIADDHLRIASDAPSTSQASRASAVGFGVPCVPDSTCGTGRLTAQLPVKPKRRQTPHLGCLPCFE